MCGTFGLRDCRDSAVIATLGIGIGAAVGIGTIVYGVLLRDLPYDKPDQLVRVGFFTDGIATPGDLHSAATYFHFAKSARSFTDLGAYSTSDAFSVTDGDAPERVTVALMTLSTFTLLGVRPLLGQLFERGDTSWSNPRTAILLSESFWRRRYGADPTIVGRQIDIDHGERTVVGVLPRSFAFPTASIDIFYPAAIPVKPAQITSRYFNVIGRLRDDIEPSAAEAELNVLTPTIAERFPAITPDMLQRLATSLFGTTDVVGRRIVRAPARAGAPSTAFTIVGVAGDVHWERIEDGYAPMVYFPILRDGDGLPADSTPVPYKPRDVQFAIRGTQLPTAPKIQEIVTELDRRVPATKVRTLGAVVDDATARVRLTMLLIVVAGVAALLLGVIGVYSVVAYAANGRVREFGIRLALGAAPTRVGATALLVVVTLFATLLPARRAARTHPAVVLRAE